MLDDRMKKFARVEAFRTDRDGKERAVVFDFNTGKPLKENTGSADGVEADIPDGVTGGTLHTHTNGDNTPSPLDLLTGFGRNGDFDNRSRAEYIAAGKTLLRWQWLKVPKPEDAKRIKSFDTDNQAGRIDFDAWWTFLRLLAKGGYIKLEKLS